VYLVPPLRVAAFAVELPVEPAGEVVPGEPRLDCDLDGRGVLCTTFHVQLPRVTDVERVFLAALCAHEQRLLLAREKLVVVVYLPLVGIDTVHRLQPCRGCLEAVAGQNRKRLFWGPADSLCACRNRDVPIDAVGDGHGKRYAGGLRWPLGELERVVERDAMFRRDAVHSLGDLFRELGEQSDERPTCVVGLGVPLVGVVRGDLPRVSEQVLPAPSVRIRAPHQDPPPSR
jgi:hypothetical protein